MKKRLKLWGWLISVTLVLAVLMASVKAWAEGQAQVPALVQFLLSLLGE